LQLLGVNRPAILQNRYALFAEHDRRLRESPNPEAAAGKFHRRVRRAKRATALRLAFFIGLYFSIVAASVSFIARQAGMLAELEFLMTLLAPIASSLAFAFVAGIFLINRYLNLLEVDLYYYSAEQRLARTMRRRQGTARMNARHVARERRPVTSDLTVGDETERSKRRGTQAAR
jgi:hypothetical protein